MKTIKQLFKEAGSIYRDDTDEPTYIYQYKALEKVKEWLTQKRQKVREKQGYDQALILTMEEVYDELLEETEK